MAQPHLLVEAGDCHDVALLPGDPGRVDRIAGHCDDVEVVAENREYKVVNATFEGRPLTVCSTGIGCPSAAIAVEELSAVGVETFLRVGTTGALQEGIEIGDMVVATGAAKEEGTSKRYESVEYPAVPDYGALTALVDAAEANEERAAQEAADGASSAERSSADRSSGPRGGEAASNGTAEPSPGPREDGEAASRVHVGPIVSDDAFYSEDDYVDDWEAAGLLAIEMEAAAIFSLARRKGLAAGAICTVDGNLVEGTQKGETDEGQELPEKASNNVERMIRIGLTAATDL